METPNSRRDSEHRAAGDPQDLLAGTQKETNTVWGSRVTCPVSPATGRQTRMIDILPLPRSLRPVVIPLAKAGDGDSHSPGHSLGDLGKRAHGTAGDVLVFPNRSSLQLSHKRRDAAGQSKTWTDRY